MFSFLQTPFLQALGYAIANSLWQVFLLWLIVIVVNGIAKQSSVIRYITALSAQIAGFVWFVTTVQFYYQHCYKASLQAEQLLSQQEVVYTQTFVTNDGIVSYLIKAEATLPYLSIAYLFLLLLLLVKWFNNFRFTKQLSTQGLEPANSHWQRFVSETADQLNIMQNVSVYLSSLAKSPLTIGYIKPIILLPIASINQLTTEQLEAVLLHELAHIKRSDYLINLLISIIEIILFFNPFTRLLGKQIKEERENCCDDWVLQFQYDAAMYAEALLRIAYHEKNMGFELNAASQKKGVLLQRVKRMIQPQKSFNYKHQVIALFLITGLLFSIAWLQPVKNKLDKTSVSNIKEVNKKIVVTPLAAQVDNPFFNAASLFSKSLQDDVKKSLADMDKVEQDSLTSSSLLQAQKALKIAIPEVVATVSSAGWQKMMDNAKQEAAKSIAGIDWQAIQDEIPQAYDSLSFVQDAANEFTGYTDKVDEIKKGLAIAKDAFAKAQKENFKIRFDRDFLQQLTANAFTSLKKIDFKAMQDSLGNTTSMMLNEIVEKQKLQQEEFRKKQKEWQKKAENKALKSQDINGFAPPPAPLPTVPTLDAEDNINGDKINLSTFSNLSPAIPTTVFSVPVFDNNVRQDNIVKTIRIINNGDSARLNIIIEIRQ